jgi:drug/metabolite transporter (DMT)-like permease
VDAVRQAVSSTEVAQQQTTSSPADAGVPGLLDWGVLVLPGVIWGASFLFIAEGLQAIGPNGVTFLRIAVGFATLSCLPAARGGSIARADRLGTALLGVFWMAFPLSMFPLAEQHVSSALTGMLNGATPLFAATVAALLARRFPDRGTATGLAIGFAGTVLIAVPGLGVGAAAGVGAAESAAAGAAGGDGGSTLGVALILIAMCSYGIALNLARPLQQRNGALPVVWRALGVACLLTMPLGVRDLLAAQWSPFPLVPLLCLLALGSLGTGVAYVLVALAAGKFGATRASATTFLIPVVALILGVTLRGEHVAALSIAGAGVCLAGAWLIRRAQQRQQTQALAGQRRG